MKKILFSLLLVTLGAGLALSFVHAKRMYKYRDENGIVHYTDKEPVTDQPVESRIVNVEPKEDISMRRLGPKHQPEYWFTNHLYGPVQIGLRFEKQSNVSATPRFPTTFVLDARAEQKLFELNPVNQRKGWSYRLNYRYVPGDPAARPQREVLYLPPFPKGHRYLISQAFGGTTTHNSLDAHYAVDITMPVGVPVLAARGGRVMDVQDDFHKSGLNLKKYGRKANVVRILHEDGTMAVYAHLQLDSIVVHKGTYVAEGEMIARSGNTGYSSGPHLHFVVQRNSGMKLESVPFRFATPKGGSLTPSKEVYLHGTTALIEK